MFESDIERNKIRLLELVNSTHSPVYLNEILSRASIDYAYKQYFEAEFGWWLYEEQTLRQTNPNLDLQDPETQAILHSLDNQYRKCARFDREQLILIVDAAVKSVLNYRLRPRTTLKWFVYRGEPTKPIYEVYLRMRYFADYRYLHEGFNQWLLKRGLRYDSLEIISVLEFERIIKKIDDDTILELSPSQFVELISPINTFFADHAVDIQSQTIPIEALIIFLDDKEVYIIAQKLERMLYQDGIRHITKDMFLRAVDEVLAEVETQGVDGGDSTRPTIVPAHGIEERSSQQAPVSDLTSAHKEEAKAEQVAAQIPAPPAPETPTIQSTSVIEELAHITKRVIVPIDVSAENAEDSSADIEAEKVADANPAEVMQQHSEASSTDSAFLHTEASTEESLFQKKSHDDIDAEDVHTEIAASQEASTPTSDSYSDLSATVEETSARAHTAQSAVVETTPPATQQSVEEEATIAPAQQAPSAVSEIVSRDSSHSAEKDADRGPVSSDADNGRSPEILGIISRALQNPASENENIEPSEQTIQRPRSAYFERVVESEPVVEAEFTGPKVYPSVKSFFDDRQRESYIKKLCSRDEARFEGLIQSLDSTSNWKEALAFLDKFYSQESIDPQSSIARDFRMAVYKRFIAL